MLVNKLEIKKNYQTWSKMKKARQEQLTALNQTKVTNGQEGLKEAIKECKSTIKSLKQEYWALFKRLLDGALVTGWRKIIIKECNREFHIV